MQLPSPADSPENGPPPRLHLFLFGLLGLLVAVALAAATEGGLRLLGVGGGNVSKGFFVAVAALAPVLALGLLVQLVTALAGKARHLIRELGALEQELSAEPGEANEEAHHSRRTVWERTGSFLEVTAPFAVGLALQFVVTEAVAIYCIVAGVDERVVAVGLGAAILALLGYLLFFNVLLAGLIRKRGARSANDLSHAH